MASVVTTSIPTETVYEVETITSESLATGRRRVFETTTLTLEQVVVDDDGDLVTVTTTEESRIAVITAVTSTSTITLVTSSPIDTLYSISRSTSLPEDDDDEETTSWAPVRIPTTTSSRVPLQPATTTSASDEVVVVTQYTTITPTQASTTSTSPIATLSSSSTSSSSAIFPGNSSASSRSAANAANDQAGQSSSTGSSLSTGAIAGIAVGAVAVAIILGILGFMFCCRRRNGRNRDSMYATTGGQSDEKLAPAVFQPDYRPSRGSSRRQMANIGAAGTSSLAGVGAGVAAARRTSNQGVVSHGKNKPMPDVPPPVSSLQYMRPGPGQRTDSADSYGNAPGGISYNTPQRAGGYDGLAYGSAAAVGASLGRPNSASPALRSQGPRNKVGKRTSAPATSLLSPPMQTRQERDASLKRAKSVASIASIPAEKLGKGAGYASPMPPLDPLGKPLDQKTWRERTSKIADGFNPAALLTPEQKMRRDSQLARLSAQQAGTASSKPNLGNLAEEDVETSPLLQQGNTSFDDSPERTLPGVPLRQATSRTPLIDRSTPQEKQSVLPYASPSSLQQRHHSLPLLSPNGALTPPRAPSPNGLYPSLPPNSPSRIAALSSSLSNLTQPQYQVHQPHTPLGSYNPVRASFSGPPPASSSQAFGSRLPAIPGSRPSSIAVTAGPGSTLPEYRSSFSGAAGTTGSPYSPAAAASPQSGFFMHGNGSNGSGSLGYSGRHQGHTSIADDIYGGLTHGLSDRDLARLGQSQQAGKR